MNYETVRRSWIESKRAQQIMVVELSKCVYTIFNWWVVSEASSRITFLVLRVLHWKMRGMLSSIEGTNEQRVIEARESRSRQLLRVWRFMKVAIVDIKLSHQQIKALLDLLGQRCSYQRLPQHSLPTRRLTGMQLSSCHSSLNDQIVWLSLPIQCWPLGFNIGGIRIIELCHEYLHPLFPKTMDGDIDWLP